MQEILEKHTAWETDLAPRLIIGLWHTCFIRPAREMLGHCPIIHLGVSTQLARDYFWDTCNMFSMNFALLASADGQRCTYFCYLS